MSDPVIPTPQLDREIATTLDGRDITRGYTGELLVPTDRVLRNRGGYDLRIYEQVLSEPMVKAVFEQRRNAVTHAEWSVDAASEKPLDVQAADFVREQLQKVGWDRITDRMLYGVFFGFAVAEIIYGRDGALLTWESIKVRNRRRFRFDKDGNLRLLTFENMLPGEPALAPYFWYFAVGADNDDEPYGLGLGHWCYWPALFKRNGIKFWLVFLEKFGMPTVLGKYDPNSTIPERAKLLAATQAIQTDAGVIIPESMTIELLEAARSGTADYKTMHDTMDDTIAKAVLGQSMTSQKGSSGGLAQAKVHHEVRQDIVKADADLICESFTLGPVRWLCQFNFPGAELPRVTRLIEEPEDTNALADRDTKIELMGFKPGLAYVKETYGDHWEEGPPPPDLTPGLPGTPGTPKKAGPSGAATSSTEFADPTAVSDAPAHMADAASAAIAPATDAWIEQIKQLVNRAQDLQQVRDGLLALAPDMTLDQYTKAMQQALAAAALAGRYEILREAGGA